MRRQYHDKKGNKIFGNDKDNVHHHELEKIAFLHKTQISNLHYPNNVQKEWQRREYHKDTEWSTREKPQLLTR